MSIGTSTLYSTEWIVEHLRALQPSSILDVGCGWGRWGFLAREFLEIWEHRFRDWRVRIDAVDIHPGTWTPVHTFVYDRIIEADIRELTPDPYDVAICCDVIEHMDRDDGTRVLNTLREACGHVLVGIPLGAGWLRPGHDDNPFEAHLTEWDDVTFTETFAPLERRPITIEGGMGYGLYVLG